MRLLILALVALSICGGRAFAATHKSAEPPARQKQIFIVIDDAGLVLSQTQQFIDIPVHLTMAVLPHQKQTTEVCKAIARYQDKEIILHQPMEAYDANKNPGLGAIYSTTRPAQVASVLKRNLASVRGAVGINNHMGSRITENAQLMGAVLHYCKANDLFFLDSKTAYNSVVSRSAAKQHMHFEERHVFLDIQHDRDYVRRMWGNAIARARSEGYVIVIGHAWCAETAAAIRDSYQTLLNQGYTFHLLSELYE